MKKRTLSLFLVMVMVIGLLPVTAQAGQLENGLEYEIYEDHVEITGYYGDATEVVIPAEIESLPVTVIDSYAFSNCDGLIGIDIPDSVTHIDDSAFSDCSSLNSINIPDGVTYIGDRAFSDCSSLESINIPDAVTSIGDSVFFGCINLTSINIPGSVTSIGDSAFCLCENLTSITIPDGVTYIGDGAFNGCDSLTGIYVDVRNPNYSSDSRGVLFDKEKTLLIKAPVAIADSYAIPDGVISISDNAFEYCLSLTGITIPDSVTDIGDFAFDNCRELTSISIPDSVSYIGYCVFDMCYSLSEIHVDENNPYYSSDSRGVLFDKEKTILILAPCAIEGTYTIPEGVTHIGKNSFRNCNRLTSIDIPDSVTRIGECAFIYSALTSIDIPDSVTYIGDHAFDCYNLTGIYVDKNNQYYSSDSRGVLFNKEKTILIKAPEAITDSYAIPEEVTHISDGAFSDCDSLTSISIPGSVTVIGENAFGSCDRLRTIFFEGNIPDINDWGFDYTTATAYYPIDNPTWTDDVKQDYGGTITWVPYDPNHTHEYSTVVTIPTCTEQGYTTYTCHCGYGYVSDYVEALGHEYVDGKCIRCSDEDPNYEKPVENPFSDVPAGSFYYEPVMWAVENGITNGATATTFNPNGTCLRAHVVTFLHRAAGNPVPSSTSNPFTDVKTGDFFYQPVLWAVENGITNGTSATTFGSYANCNRAAVVTFLWRAAGSPEPQSTTNPFVDVKTTDFFYKPVLWAVENGITNGVDATHFGPASDCNRAQVVTFLYRAFNEQ